MKTTHMKGPYRAEGQGNSRSIYYNGNAITAPCAEIEKTEFTASILENRLGDIEKNPEYYFHLHRIDHGIFNASVAYFQSIGADWCNLPLTTLMISSPGEVYAGKILDYTTDTLPVDITWFDAPRNIFLSESSQFYLELRLIIQNIKKVFSIYNSFRKESADHTHLSEFQHIEFEGKVPFQENISIFVSLVREITAYLLKNERESIEYFIGRNDTEELQSAFSNDAIETITFEKALKTLRKHTGDPRYDEFSLKNFGAWEEIKLTEIFQKHLIVTHFPLLQIPFYHNESKKSARGIPLAENADFIFYGYREVIGSGSRITNPDALAEKARTFNLPASDYEPYLRTRHSLHYEKTSGFGLGWQRYVQWLLRLPVIWEATHIPRGHHLPKL